MQGDKHSISKGITPKKKKKVLSPLLGWQEKIVDVSLWGQGQDSTFRDNLSYSFRIPVPTPDSSSESPGELAKDTTPLDSSQRFRLSMREVGPRTLFLISNLGIFTTARVWGPGSTGSL